MGIFIPVWRIFNFSVKLVQYRIKIVASLQNEEIQILDNS